MMSQLSYIGTILKPPETFLQNFDKCVISFINQGSKISEKRIFENKDVGGLGLTRAKDFIESLKVNFFLEKA